MRINLRKWIFEQNRNIAICLGVIVFCVIVFSVIHEIFDNESIAQEPVGWTGTRWRRLNYCSLEACDVTCISVPENDIAKHIQGAIGDCETINLAIHYTNFPKHTVSKDWLQKLKAQIKSLIFHECHIKTIDDAAFIGNPFHLLKELVISDSRIEYIQNGALDGLHKLKKLLFLFQNANTVTLRGIEENALKHLTSLTTLKFQNCLKDPIVVWNITNKNTLPNLHIIDLRDNALKELNAFYFSNIPSIKCILLSNNLLEYISEYAFAKLQLEELHLNSNKLKTIKEGTFNYMNQKNGNILLFDNPWNCDCNLQWLRDYYLSDDSLISPTKPLLCDNAVNFNSVTFCNTISTSTVRTTDRSIKSEIPDASYCNKQATSETCCHVICENLPEKEIQSQIIKTSMGCAEIELEIHNSAFPDLTITEGWLAQLPAKVKTLQLRKCNFKFIGDGAFSGHPFKLTTLEIMDPQVEFIQRGALRGLSELGEFSFQFFEHKSICIEQKAFEEINSIYSLQLLKCLNDPETISNITGINGSEFPNLEMIDLQYNNLRELHDNSFIKAAQVRKITLGHNSLTHISKNVFANVPLQALYINDNLLKYIEEGIFDYMQKNGAGIFAQNNSWLCNCELEWFQKYYLSENSLVDKTSPPLCNNTDPFETTVFCDTKSSVTSTSTETTEIFYCSLNDCNIKCKNIPEEAIKSEIIKSSKGCGKINLSISNTNFPKKTIIKGWLNGLESTIKVLEFIYCPFKIIGEGAFSGEPFKTLEKLIIIESQVEIIRKGALNELFQLDEFSFQFNSFNPICVEQNAFDDLNSISSLQFNRCLNDPQTISNITGISGSALPNLLQIDLGYNNLRELHKYSFVNATQVQKITLNNNLLEYINKNVFANVPLMALYLNNNQLRTIEEGIFDHMVQADSDGIFLQNNPWNCNCELEWLKYYCSNENSLVNKTMPPLCNNTRPFEDVEVFCETSSSAITTTSSTTYTITTSNTATTSSTTYTIPIVECIGISNDLTEIPDGVSKALIEEKNVPYQNEIVNIKIYDVDYSINTYISMNASSNVGMIWVGSNPKHDYKCIKKLPRAFMLEDVVRGNTYTMCLLNELTLDVQPFNCFGIRILDELKDRAWIKNEDKLIIIPTACAVLLLSMLICGFTVFWIIRQHPNLISGNKRVVVVGSKETDAMIMPKNFETPMYITPTPVIYSQSGYLTPNFPVYDRVNYMATLKKKKMNSRSIILDAVEKSSNDNSDILTFRNSIRKVPFEQSGFVEASCSETPPPLPPFNTMGPKKTNYKNADNDEDDDDNYYTEV